MSEREDRPLVPSAQSEAESDKNGFGYLLGIVSFASVVSVLLGYDIGIMAGAILDIETTLALNKVQKELVVGILNFVSAFGGLFAAAFGESLGRRMCIFICMALQIFGTAMMTLAQTFAVMFVGRVVSGLGVGCGMATVPVYIAEVAPARLRGKLCACFEIAACTGLLLGYASSLACSRLPADVSWRVMIGAALIPSVVVLCSTFRVLPESPRWLLRHGKEWEARSVLLMACGGAEADAAMRSMKDLVDAPESDPEQSCRGSTAATMDKSSTLFAVYAEHWRALLVGCGVAFLQQANGSEAAVYYVPKLMERAGVTERVHQLWGQFAVGVFKAGFILAGLALLDRVGRRPLLLTSVALVTLCLFALAAGFATSAPPTFTIGTLCCFMGSFSIGEGPVTWVVMSEVFPLALRSRAAAFGTFLNRSTSGIIAMSFLSLSDAVTPAGAFSIFGTVSALHFVFVYCWMPETKGKSLEEIEVTLSSKSSTESGGSIYGAVVKAKVSAGQGVADVVVVRPVGQGSATNP